MQPAELGLWHQALEQWRHWRINWGCAGGTMHWGHCSSMPRATLDPTLRPKPCLLLLLLLSPIRSRGPRRSPWGKSWTWAVGVPILQGFSVWTILIAFIIVLQGLWRFNTTFVAFLSWHASLWPLPYVSIWFIIQNFVYENGKYLIQWKENWGLFFNYFVC